MMYKIWTIIIFSLVFFAVGCAQASQQNNKQLEPHYKVLYSNDTTHILTCASPYHKKGEPFNESMLRASIKETAGMDVDVHMLQPGTMWTPWWQSNIYSITDHYAWFKSRYGFKPASDFNEYVYGGGDMVKVLVETCREYGLSPFVSFRMNDGHYLRWDYKRPPPSGYHTLSKFYVEHAPEYCIGDKFEGEQLDSWDARVQNWSIPEVRQYKLSLIEELCKNYDLDGIELDFMRHASYFDLSKTTSEERKAIMSDVIRSIRTYLDNNSHGNRRKLCVRIPAFISDHDRIGLDVKKWAEAGVDMFNISSHYFLCQQTDLPQMVKMAPNKAFYLEMTHTTRTGKVFNSKSYDGFTIRRSTETQFYTAAHLAYSRGAQGVSTFNFQYYREFGDPRSGPFFEPPFHIFKNIGDPDWVAQQPQHYILAGLWNGAQRHNPQIPKAGYLFKPGVSATFKLDMAPRKGGWRKDGTLRVQGSGDISDVVFEVTANGTPLVSTTKVGEPYNNPYPQLLGDGSVHKGWIVPSKLLKDGVNQFHFTMNKGNDCTINFIDLAIE
ncbi:hypothetical protein [Poriferisphaera sp. WC338]|uniref:hypothetical protein n=1 Tax=Poriferisphaera sp. WC338 TaxID=3425129 RepID=UPI003D812F57